jgi:hypothetical protein
MNGRSVEILKWLVALACAAIVSYFTSLGAIQTQVAVLEERTGKLYEIDAALYQIRAQVAVLEVRSQITSDDTKEVKADLKLLLRRVE